MHLADLMWAFASSLSINTMSILLLANGCTLVCFYTNTSYPMRLDLIGIAVVFPLVFSINGAFNRREQALKHLSEMKANAYTIRYVFHHGNGGEFQSGEGPKEIDHVLYGIFARIANYFKSDEFSEIDYVKITSQFAQISWLIEIHLRKGGLHPACISRLLKAMRWMMLEFELLRNIKIYRTPLALRAYTKIFVLMFPILYAPLFASLAVSNGLWGALLMTTLFSCILAGLDNIQDGLEEPFDGLGIDDVQFDQYIRRMRLPTVTPTHREYDFDKYADDIDEEAAKATIVMKSFSVGEKSISFYIDEEESIRDIHPDIMPHPLNRSCAPMINLEERLHGM